MGEIPPGQPLSLSTQQPSSMPRGEPPATGQMPIAGTWKKATVTPLKDRPTDSTPGTHAEQSASHMSAISEKCMNALANVGRALLCLFRGKLEEAKHQLMARPGEVQVGGPSIGQQRQQIASTDVYKDLTHTIKPGAELIDSAEFWCGLGEAGQLTEIEIEALKGGIENLIKRYPNETKLADMLQKTNGFRPSELINPKDPYTDLAGTKKRTPAEQIGAAEIWCRIGERGNLTQSEIESLKVGIKSLITTYPKEEGKLGKMLKAAGKYEAKNEKASTREPRSH